MEVRIILGVTYVAVGIFGLIVAHLYIRRKQDIFAYPPTLYRILFAQRIRRLESLGRAAMDFSNVDQKKIIDMTVRLWTVLALGLLVLGGILLVYPWSLTLSIVISSIGSVTLMAYFIIVFVCKCISFSKNAG